MIFHDSKKSRRFAQDWFPLMDFVPLHKLRHKARLGAQLPAKGICVKGCTVFINKGIVGLAHPFGGVCPMRQGLMLLKAVPDNSGQTLADPTRIASIRMAHITHKPRHKFWEVAPTHEQWKIRISQISWRLAEQTWPCNRHNRGTGQNTAVAIRRPHSGLALINQRNFLACAPQPYRTGSANDPSSDNHNVL